MTSSASYDVGDQKAHVTELGQAETQTIPLSLAIGESKANT